MSRFLLRSGCVAALLLSAGCIDINPNAPIGIWSDPSDGDDADTSGETTASDTAETDAAPSCAYPTATGGCASVTRLVLSAGAHACATLDTGDTYCWGARDLGQLGDGFHATPGQARKLNFSSNIAEVALNGRATNVLTADGVLWGFGRNAEGELGQPTPDPVEYPTVIDRPPLKRVFAGWHMTCGVTMDDELLCWGRPAHLPHRAGQPHFEPDPYTVPIDGEVVDLVAGSFHICAIVDPAVRRLLCWGLNSEGVLGIGNNDLYVPDPQPTGLTGVQSVTAGEFHTCAVADHTAYCWGSNDSGQIGAVPQGGGKNTPTVVGTTHLPNPIVDVAAGRRFSCFLDDQRTMYCSGNNESALIGTAAPGFVTPPAENPQVAYGVAHLRAGWQQACVVRDDGAIVCWGDDREGIQAQPTFGSLTSPPKVVPLPL